LCVFKFLPNSWLNCSKAYRTNFERFLPPAEAMAFQKVSCLSHSGLKGAASAPLQVALSCQLCSWLPDAARLWLTHGCMLDKRHLRPCAKWDVVLQTRLSRLFMHVVTVGCGRWGLLQRRKFQLIWKPESISTGHLPDVSVLCAGCDISGDNAASWPVCCTSCH